jgi:hypothetical protein
MINDQWSIINYQWSRVNDQQSVNQLIPEYADTEHGHVIFRYEGKLNAKTHPF